MPENQIPVPDPPEIVVAPTGEKPNVSTTDEKSPAGYVNVSVTRTRELTIEYSGVLPPPSILQQYDVLDPGRAGKLFQLAEDQSRHRMDIEGKVINSDIQRSREGLWIGAGLSALVVIGGIVLTLCNYPSVGAILIGIDVISLAGLFVYGTERRRSERIAKSKQTQLPPPAESAGRIGDKERSKADIDGSIKKSDT